MCDYLGTNHSSTSWSKGTIVNGVWMEDLEDVVYLYSMDNPPNVTCTVLPSPLTSQQFFSILESFYSDDFFVSTTHFWDADNGDLPQSLLESGFEIFAGDVEYYFYVPNAYQKMLKYKNGGWTVYWNAPDYLRLQSENGHTLRIERLFAETPLSLA